MIRIQRVFLVLMLSLLLPLQVMAQEEVREGEDTVLRTARFDTAGDALNEASRLLPPGT